MAILKSSTAYTRMFLIVQTSDHLSGLTGASPTVTLSKAGAAFGAAGGTVTEVSSGWYKIALTTTDTNTIGDLAYHITAASGDATDFVDQVSAIILSDLTTAAIATGVWTDTTAGDFTVSASIGKSVMNGVSLGTGLTINSYTGNTVQTGDAYARLGAPVVSVSADLAAVKTDTGNIVTQTNKLTFTVANKVDANTLAMNGNATAAANVAHSMQAITRGTCSGGTTATAVVSTLTSPGSLGASGQLIGRTILFDADTTTTNLQGQASNITASTTGATPTITFTAMTTAPVNGDTFSVL